MDADLACSLLEEHAVPFYRGTETSGGLKTAMGVAPTPGPGTWFTVWVPPEAEPQARELLQGLPFDLDRQPDVVDFSSSPRARTLSKIFAVLVLVLFAMGFYQQCSSAIRQLFTR
jgi:hypothetical protein